MTRDALFRQAGVLAVDQLDELSELVATLSWQPLPAGRRTAVISNAGGVGCARGGRVRGTRPGRATAVRSDAAGATPAAAARCRHGQPGGHHRGDSRGVFASAISALRADPDVDAVLAVTVATALADPFDGVADAARRHGGPLVAVRLGQPEHVVGVPVPGTDRTVPVFADTGSAAGALAQAAERAEWLARPRGTGGPIAGVDAVRAGGVVARFLAVQPEGGWLEPAQVQDVLESFGLPILRSVVADDPDQAVTAFAAVDGPVALKVVADGVLHKAAAGGVRLGLDSADAVRRAAAELAVRFGPRLRGFLVQPMVPAGPELLVGVTSEPVFGPLVAVGLGGTVTDLAADRAHRLVPLSDADAEEMLGGFHAGARLFDLQRSPALDRGAVVDVIVRVGRLAERLPEIVELDLQPARCRARRVRRRRRPDPCCARVGGRPRAPDARLLTGDLTIRPEPTASNVRRMRGEQHR